MLINLFCDRAKSAMRPDGGLMPRLALFVLLAGTLQLLGWVFWACGYGFDFTDEGLYLNWMRQPFSYKFSANQCGFLFHPLYLALDGNIAALRRINILLTFGAAWLFGTIFLRSCFGDQKLSAKSSGILASAWLIDGSLAVFVTRLRGGAALAMLMHPNYQPESLLRVDSLPLSLIEYP